jgi:Short C-terminal domain
MPGLLRGVARTAVVAGTAAGVAGRVHHRQEGRWAQQEQEAAAQQAPPAYAQQAPPAYAQPAPAPAEAPSGGMDDKLAQLQQLGQLRDAGVLSDAEFEAQKGKILYA